MSGPFEAISRRDAEGKIEYELGAPGEEGKPVSAVENPFVKAIAADYMVDEIDQQTGDIVLSCQSRREKCRSGVRAGQLQRRGADGNRGAIPNPHPCAHSVVPCSGSASPIALRWCWRDCCSS